MNHVTHPFTSADISIFSPEISKFCYIKKYRYSLYFDTKFQYILNFLESLEIRLKLRVKKVLGANSDVCTIYRRKTGRGPFCPSPPSWKRLKTSYKYLKVMSGRWLSRDVSRASILKTSTKRISVVIVLV